MAISIGNLAEILAPGLQQIWSTTTVTGQQDAVLTEDSLNDAINILRNGYGQEMAKSIDKEVMLEGKFPNKAPVPQEEMLEI